MKEEPLSWHFVKTSPILITLAKCLLFSTAGKNSNSTFQYVIFEALEFTFPTQIPQKRIPSRLCFNIHISMGNSRMFIINQQNITTWVVFFSLIWRKVLPSFFFRTSACSVVKQQQQQQIISEQLKKKLTTTRGFVVVVVFLFYNICYFLQYQENRKVLVSKDKIHEKVFQ